MEILSQPGLCSALAPHLRAPHSSPAAAAAIPVGAAAYAMDQPADTGGTASAEDGWRVQERVALTLNAFCYACHRAKVLVCQSAELLQAIKAACWAGRDGAGQPHSLNELDSAFCTVFLVWTGVVCVRVRKRGQNRTGTVYYSG